MNSKCTVALCSEYTRPLSFENFLICLDRFVLRDLGANEYLAFYFLFYFIFFIFVLGTGPALDLAANEYWAFYGTSRDALSSIKDVGVSGVASIGTTLHSTYVYWY